MEHPCFLVSLTDVGVRFDIALSTGFTPILAFPHQGGRDSNSHLNTY